MKTYFTGTTLECLISILKDGYIKKSPSERVWVNYSEEYTYFIPTSNKFENRDTFLSYAFEQADFAVYELNGTKRVVLEVEGLDESKLEKDPDASGIYAVRYPFDVPVSCIKNIYLDVEDKSDQIKEFVALTKLILPENKKELDKVEQLMCEGFDEDIQYFYSQIHIKHVEFIPIETLSDISFIEDKYHDYHEELDYSPEYELFSVDEFSSRFLTLQPV